MPVSTVQTMAKERQHVSFNARELTYFLDGGERMTKVDFFCTVALLMHVAAQGTHFLGD